MNATAASYRRRWNLANERQRLLQVIQTQLRNRSRDARDATVSCPEIVIAAKGRTFDCQLTIDGEQRRVVARQTDAGGNFTYRVLTG